MANHVLGLVRRIFTWAMETDKLQASPCVGLRKPAVARARDRVLSHDEIKLVLDTIEKSKRKGRDGKLIDSSYGRPFAKAFFRLALLTAARKGELLGAKWSDIDLGEKLWMIPDTKMGRAHVLPLSSAAVDVLEALPRESEWVLRSMSGRIVNHPKRAIRDMRTDTGLEFTIHDLRRTTATGLAQLGVRTEAISAVLNHVVSGPEATRVYQRHSWIPEMRQALERWAQELERIRQGKAAKVVLIS